MLRICHLKKKNSYQPLLCAVNIKFYPIQVSYSSLHKGPDMGRNQQCVSLITIKVHYNIIAIIYGLLK